MNEKKSFRWYMILIGLITAGIGGLLLYFPKDATVVLSLIVGWVLVSTGVLSVIMFIRGKKSDGKTPWLTLFTGIIETACGVGVVISPDYFVNFITIILSFLIIFNGMNDIYQGIAIKNMGHQKWKMPLIIGIIYLICAFIILYNPFASYVSLLMVLGVILIFNGITEILFGIFVSKWSSDFYKALEKEEEILKEEFRKAEEAENNKDDLNK